MELAETNDISVQDIKKRSISGVFALVTRTFVVQIITFVSTLLLTIFLDANTYGVFYLVSSVVNFLAYFSDIGLAAALIQKKENLGKEDLSTTFTIQQTLVVSLLLLLIVSSPIIKSQYNISDEGMILLYAMGLSFFLSSLKTIPSILLEREIKFNKLILPQILETLTFNIVAVIAAWKGYGLLSFAFAVTLRGLVGLVAIYVVYPWKPTLGIYRSSLSSLLKFGLPYQINTFLAVLKDDGMTIILTKIIGTEGLGYLGWASRWAGLPLRILMDNLTKVSFPAFARLQSHEDKLAKAVELNLKYLSLLSLPLLVGMGFMAEPLIHQIPKYTKWIPALIPLYIQLYNSAWAGISTSLTNLLNATGKIKLTFRLMLMWTGLTWLLMPFLAQRFGYLGVSYAVGIIATSSLVTVILAKQVVKFSLLKSLSTPFIATVILAIFLALTRSYTYSIPNIAAVVFTSIVIYGLAVLVIEGKSMVQEVKSLLIHRHA